MRIPAECNAGLTGCATARLATGGDTGSLYPGLPWIFSIYILSGHQNKLSGVLCRTTPGCACISGSYSYLCISGSNSVFVFF